MGGYFSDYSVEASFRLVGTCGCCFEGGSMNTKAKAYCTSKSLQTSQSPVPSQCHHKATRTPLTKELTPTGPALSVPLMRITESLLHKCPLSLCLLTQPALSEVLCNMSFLSGASGNKLPCTVLALELLALSHVNNHASEVSPVRETKFLLQLPAAHCLGRSCCPSVSRHLW